MPAGRATRPRARTRINTSGLGVWTRQRCAAPTSPQEPYNSIVTNRTTWQRGGGAPTGSGGDGGDGGVATTATHRRQSLVRSRSSQHVCAACSPQSAFRPICRVFFFLSFSLRSLLIYSFFPRLYSWVVCNARFRPHTRP